VTDPGEELLAEGRAAGITGADFPFVARYQRSRAERTLRLVFFVAGLVLGVGVGLLL
jgi:hypothetical protein